MEERIRSKVVVLSVDKHKNVEKVIRYYLSFLPPRGVESILDIGCGRSAPYQGILSNRCDRYESLDVRPGPKVSVASSVFEMPFKDEEFEWGWCTEMIEHLSQKKQTKAVKEIMRVCQNCVFTYPLITFQSTGNTVPRTTFYDDPGHVEVIVKWDKLFSETHDIADKTTKNGRGIFILTKKGYNPQPSRRQLFE